MTAYISPVGYKLLNFLFTTNLFVSYSVWLVKYYSLSLVFIDCQFVFCRPIYHVSKLLLYRTVRVLWGQESGVIRKYLIEGPVNYTLATSVNLMMTLALCRGVVLLRTMHWIHWERPLNSAIECSSLALSFSEVVVA